MITKQEESASKVDKLKKYVDSVENGDYSIPMRNDDVYVKGVWEIILERKFPRASTWINRSVKRTLEIAYFEEVA